ncbi:putative sensor domain DACNV-containing protein [Desulfosediminicola ganghwensis]|uniref:putative sensor domain DACNV-containing protein n=1 Tax=Desulfosediminicola ganghwensis TaxID=2569540 RepID=UPI0010AC01AA|nr:hypothetical protein [Desulfosediminicola ganghwensis]
MIHSYPHDLVVSLQQRWSYTVLDSKDDKKTYALPATEVLNDLISTCYQVSQMQEETRQIRFRLMMAEPDDYGSADAGLLQGLFVMKFTNQRPFNTYELLKLAPALNFNNAMIGVRFREKDGLQIWGVIHTGSRWTQIIHGGSKTAVPLPKALAVHVMGPGRLTVFRGHEILVQLSAGKIISPAVNVFQAEWMTTRFSQVQKRLSAIHAQNPELVKNEWAKVDPDFVGKLYLEFFKHVISTVRRSGHGGMILSFPAGMANLISKDNPYISIKYRFTEGGASQQLKTLVLEIMKVLSIVCGRRYGPDYVAGWDDYVELQGKRLIPLDEQVFKYARFVAGLTGVDGAVVTTEGPELIGYGGIIQGNFEMGEHVAKALDPEGIHRKIERIESVGTRHRSCYYLCKKLHDALGIVVSQDGEVRIVTWGEDSVLYWDVIPIDFATD